MKIITNNIPRKLLNSWELTKRELAEFDYYTEEELQGLSFVRYKRQCYCLSDFMRTGVHEDLYTAGWQGYAAATAWSGVLVRLVNGCEQVVMGSYYA